MDDAEQLRAIALLCHPEPGHRRMAALAFIRARADAESAGLRGLELADRLRLLELTVQGAADPQFVRTLLSAERSPESFARILFTLGWEPEPVRRELEALLDAPGPAIRLGAAAGLSLMGSPAGTDTLRAALRDAQPASYPAVLELLALVDGPTAIPLLAVFCLAAPPARSQPLPDAQLGIVGRAPAFGGLPLGPLVRAHAWCFRPSPGEALASPRGLRPIGVPGIAAGETVPPSDFARTALWKLGCAGLLTAIDPLAAGAGDAIVAARDPRLFETLAVALLRHPGLEPGQRIGLAAVRGLLALGEPRCLALLDWFGSVWRLPAAVPTVWQQARAAAACLRGRLGAVGGELVPASTPNGLGTEVAEARDD